MEKRKKKTVKKELVAYKIVSLNAPAKKDKEYGVFLWIRMMILKTSLRTLNKEMKNLLEVGGWLEMMTQQNITEMNT